MNANIERLKRLAGAAGRRLAPLSGRVAAVARRDAKAPAVVLAAGLVLAPLALIVWLSPVAIATTILADVFIPLDAAWRWHWGQLPHRDFMAPVGILYFAIHGFAFDHLAADGREVMRSNLLVLPFVFAAGICLIPRRFGAATGALAIAFLGTATISPHFLDGWMWDWAHLASYNRHSWVLLGLVAIALLVEPKRPAGRAAGLVDGVVCGLLILALAHIKMTAAIAALVLAAGAIVLNPRLKTQALVAAGLSMGAFALLWALGLETGYLRDLAVAGSVADSLVRWDKIPHDLHYDAPILAMSALALWPALVFPSLAKSKNVRPDARPALRQPLLAFLVFVGMTLAVSNQDHEHLGLILPIGALMAAEQVRRLPIDPERTCWSFLAAMTALLLLWGPETASVVLCWAQGELGHYQLLDPDAGSGNPYARIGGERQSLPVLFNWNDDKQAAAKARKAFADEALTVHDFIHIVADGAAALHDYAPGRGRILAAVNGEPYAVWTGTEPPTGVSLWYDLSRTLPRKGPRAAWFTLKGVDVFMDPAAYPKGDATPLLEAWSKPDLKRDFRLAGKTPFWTIYVRVQPADAAIKTP